MSVFFSLLLFSAPAGAGLESLMYWPSFNRGAETDHPGSESVNFKTENGKQIHGIYTPAIGQPSRGILVFFHGNSGDVESHYERAVTLAQKGYDHLIFDYQGFGKAEGDASLSAMVADGRAAIRWAHEKRLDLPLYVFGHSLGGAIAIKAVATVKNEVPIAGVAVQNSFYSYEAVASAVLDKNFFGFISPIVEYLINNDPSPESDIPKLSPIPFLVIHGEKDEKVPYQLGEKTYDLANAPKEFCPVFEGMHGDEVGSWAIERLKAMGAAQP